MNEQKYNSKLYLRNSLEKYLPLDLNESAEILDKKIRALTISNSKLPYYVDSNGKKIYIEYNKFKKMV